MNAQKIILCADMDAFFASVEQQSNPRLRGKPVAVIGSGARTVIVTRSYEARSYGVKTGMNIYEARKLCPHIIFVSVNNEKYTYTCKEIVEVYKKFTPDIETYSIDEAFLDITTTHHLFGGPENIGKLIKDAIKDKFGINCTIGIGPNILIAKLASDIAKPDGLMWIKPKEIPYVLNELPVKELWGIGSGLAQKLEHLGIRTCGELGNAPLSILRSKFGIIGEKLKAMGMGICMRPVITNECDPKSIGHGMTLEKDVLDQKEIEMQILKLSEMVGRRARRYGFIGRKISVTVRYKNFETFSKQTTLSDYTNNTLEIYRSALFIINSVKLKDRVRLLGVSISSLIHDYGQMYLLEEKNKVRAVLSAMDAINDRFGDFKMTWASYLRNRKCSMVISPAWRPSGIRNINVK